MNCIADKIGGLMDIFNVIIKNLEIDLGNKPYILKNVPEILLPVTAQILSNKFKKSVSISIVSSFQDQKNIEKDRFIINVGDTFNPDILSKYGYTKVNRVWNQNEYSVLGDVVILWKKGDREVIRISLNGKNIESISQVEESTRRFLKSISTFSLSLDTNVIYRINSTDTFNESLNISYLLNEVPLNHIDFSIKTFPGQKLSQIEQVVKSYLSQGYKIFLDSSSDVEILGCEKINSNFERGFVIPNAKIALISEFELNGKLDLSEYDKKGDKSQKIFKELVRGDYVVHEDHGIGIYTDLVIQDGKTYLDIRYAKSDRLLVPLSANKKISKYIGSGGNKPHLTGLNSGVWHRIRSKAKDDIVKMANELVGIYAMRSITKSPQIINQEFDIDDFNDFIDKFKYADTEDQAVITQEILNDFKKESPMDRLIVGDVGFGKTELAARAMFLAVNGGFQAVILAPTTILSIQHLNVLKDRFSKYPFRIEVLNRFVTGNERSKILEELKQGKVDILIGTHSLLSEKIEYKNLGLLVIDEEQKFGVAQKEKIKQKRLDINVLSMTATPIPRTLNMALSGIRDLSILSSSPIGRKSIENYIGDFSWDIVKKAISFEINRGGQIYYMHNRVNELKKIETELNTRIKGVKVGIIHGQMREHQIADVMNEFSSGKLNTLVCSSIIENGLDIPTVNTIIIDDAQRYGLSSLYQIRGRVGRSNTQAYAYILHSNLRGDATLRLDAIAEANNIGSGFILSNRDLEIRGAGNILGKSQSGAINSIGYAMYTQLLSEAISRLQDRKY